MQAVFLDQNTFIPSVSFSAIEKSVEHFVAYSHTPPDEIVTRCQNADIIVTNKVLITQAIIAQLPNLKLICVAATGTNNIDITAAEKANIKVLNVAGYSTHSVSQYVFSQLLEHFGQISINNQKVKSGQWQQGNTFCLHSDYFDELAGKTIGILGYGDIGQKVASIARAFDMKVLVAERPNANNIRADRVSFETMLQNADIVSLHCPLTEDTENLFSTQAFKQMQNHSVLINTARGGIIDNNALLSALNNHEISAAILDVLDQEPPAPDHILLNPQPDNLKITAHIAWASQQAQQKVLNLVAKNIESFLL
ncbi:D-2-hydroxyacid dehydrogenase [Catenovulum adriaticum]|uniref:D-2-hydroxyacid dehydrogenase n=1 Tax=Catenovulum adriaticum TaxID=2984846 RepID=A0ABY7ARY0_9ALTE|nr:D-2-hydroxyacid dehydrogenase [Catenovulum sp. TS8]WAJ72288.1 D-2-hydroxyacid dehydrogenase [Catenovulum sp. TS8]